MDRKSCLHRWSLLSVGNHQINIFFLVVFTFLNYWFGPSLVAKVLPNNFVMLIAHQFSDISGLLFNVVTCLTEDYRSNL